MSQSYKQLPHTDFAELLRELREQIVQSGGGAGSNSDSAAIPASSMPRVYVGGSSGEPTVLLEQLRLAPEAAAGLHFLQFPLPVLNQMDFTQLHPTTHQSVFFMTAALKNADPARLHYIPIHMRRVYSHLLEVPADIALLQVAPDRHGALRVVANADFVGAATAHPETKVVAALNESIVAPVGAPLADRLDFVLTGAGEVPEFPSAGVDDVARAIGQHVAGLINDGDCLQTGIGAIPAAVLAALGSKHDLGFHGGLIDDCVLALIDSGVMTGARKTLDPGVHTTGIVLGSAHLFTRLAGLDAVVLRGADYTHEASVIGQIDNFVSINSAVEVDVMGQINGEFAGGRQISGTGGSVDFMRSARGSKGGRSIVALPATAKEGSVSRIVQRVEMVTALRTDTDIVVTEYGVAQLRDQPLAERQKRLAAIAAPEFREALSAGKT